MPMQPRPIAETVRGPSVRVCMKLALSLNRKERSTMPNAITMLKADHTKVKQLLRRLNETGGVKQREHLCSEIEREIKMHSQLEEEIFYPAFKAATRRSEEEHLVYEATEEHHV